MKKQALIDFLGLDDEEAENVVESAYDENIFEYYDEEYEVLTDKEADERWDEELDRYLDDCVYPELSENMHQYFDAEAWKDDARDDGRGHAISRYDGSEEEVEVEGVRYYIYRQY